MKLKNETDYNSQQLKAFIHKVAEFEELTPQEIDKLITKVTYRRGNRDTASGHGTYNSWHFKLTLPKTATPDKPQIAMTIGCLLAFCQNQRSVRGTYYSYKQGWKEYWAWAKELPLELNQPGEKPALPKQEKIIAEMEHCTKMIALWETKAKLAKTKQKIWQKKFNYYERRFKTE